MWTRMLLAQKVVDVADHADDLDPLILRPVFRGDAKMPAHGIFACEVSFRKSGVNDGYGSGIRPIRRCEFTPLQQRDSQRAKIVRTDNGVVAPRQIGGSGNGWPFSNKGGLIRKVKRKGAGCR